MTSLFRRFAVAAGATVVVTAAAGTASATTPPATEPISVSPDDPFCVAGLVLHEAEAVLDDSAAEPDEIGPAMRQLLRAVDRVAEVAPAGLDGLDELAVILHDLGDLYAGHGYDVEAADDDPELEALDEEYTRYLDLADTADDLIEEDCAVLLTDDELRAGALCAASDRLGVEDDRFAEDRTSSDPLVVEAGWQRYVQAYDEVRILAPDETDAGLGMLRDAFDRFEELATEYDWDYEAATADPRFASDIESAMSDPDVQEATAVLQERGVDACDAGTTPSPETPTSTDPTDS